VAPEEFLFLAQGIKKNTEEETPAFISNLRAFSLFLVKGGYFVLATGVMELPV